MKSRCITLLMTLLLPATGAVLAQGTGTPGTTSPAGNAGGPAATALTMQAPAERSARPGSYVTLIFEVNGQGEYDFVADGGPDWVPVTRSRRVKVNQSAYVPVTFRVPAMAPVGASPALELKAVQGGVVVAQIAAHVNVEARARLSLSSPAQVTGRSGERVVFPVEVTNLGNQTDTIELKVTNVDSRPQLSEQSFVLAPGGRKTVQVSLLVEDTSPGYQFITFLEAVSANDPKARGRTRTVSVFDPVQVYGDSRDVRGPQLTFSVRSQVEGGYLWTPDGSQGYWRYQLLPGLKGQLSDFAQGDLNVTGLSGSQAHWQPAGVGAGFSIRSPRWAVSGALGLDIVEVRADLPRGEWTFSPRVSWRRHSQGRYVGLGVHASGPFVQGKLDSDLSTSWFNSAGVTQRQDALGVVYGRALSDRLGLSLGMNVYGQQQPDQYQWGLLASQQLHYDAEKFDVTQVYTVQWPGIHTLGLTAGTRNAAPFGVRAGVTVQRLPAGFSYGVSGLLTYQTQRGFGASLGARYGRSSNPDDPAQWRVEAGARLPSFKVGPSLWTVGARYSVAGTAGEPQLAQELAGTTEFQAGRLRGNAQLLWQRHPISSEADDPATQQKLAFQVQGSYLFNFSNRVAFTYRYHQIKTDTTTQLHALGLGWERQWNKRLSTQLSAGRSWNITADGQQSSDYLTAGFGVQDVLIPGLSVGAGMTFSAPQGIGQGNVQRGVRVTLGYDLSRSVATPDKIVNLFGGRKGGEVSGVLYRDTNLNGVMDTGENPLAGVTVEAGGVKSTTSPQGLYRLRLPVGQYALAFKGGLPTTLEALKETSVQVKENSTTPLNVPFAPVGMLEVRVFNDRNRNAALDEGESLIPYAGLQVNGPVSRTVKADSNGTVRISALPFGQYGLTLTQLPEGYEAITPNRMVEVKAGEVTPVQALGASLPEKKNVNTFQEGNVALLARLTRDAVKPGETTRVILRVTNADRVTLEAFGQTYTATVQNNSAEIELSLPAGTPSGQHELTLKASGAQGQKSLTLKIQVLPGS